MSSLVVDTFEINIIYSSIKKKSNYEIWFRKKNSSTYRLFTSVIEKIYYVLVKYLRIKILIFLIKIAKLFRIGSWIFEFYRILVSNLIKNVTEFSDIFQT